MWEYKRKDYLDDKGDENSNLEQGIKSMFFQPKKQKPRGIWVTFVISWWKKD